MLRKLRQKDIKKIMWALVIVIVPAFALWGISSVLQSRNRYVGIIAGRKISLSAFRDYEKNFQMLMFFSGGEDLVRKMSNQKFIALIWQQMLLAEAARKEKIRVDDKELIARLESLPLLNYKGRFSQQFYLSRLKAAGIVPSRFESFLKDTIAAEKLIAKIRASVKIKETDILKLYREENEKVKISYLLIDYAKTAADINPQEKDLAAYFKKHKEDFRIPPKVKIQYLVIPAAHLKKLYAFIRKSHKNYSLENIAKAFSLKIESSDYFSLSEPIKNLGWAKKINEIAFSLAENQTSKPIVLSADKVIIIKKVAAKEAYLPTFKGSEAQVRKAYINDASRRKAETIAKELLQKAAKEHLNNLKELLKTLPARQQKCISLLTSPYFSRYAYLENIGMNQDLIKAVFQPSYRGKIINRAFPLRQGIAIVKVEDFVPIDRKKFSDEKEKYRRRLLAFKQQLALSRYLSSLYKNSRFLASTLP